MNKVNKIKPNRVYVTDDTSKLREVQPLEVKHDGISYGLQLDLYKTLDEKYKRLQLVIENAKSSLTATLILNGIHNTSDDLNSIVQDVSRLKTIIPSKEHNVFTLNKDRYILKVDKLNGEIEEVICGLPYDIENGCYKLEDGVPILDKNKQKQLAMVVL